MTPELIEKLKIIIGTSITSESQIVHFMVSIRKILEQENLKHRYPYLNFYCNWVVHYTLNQSPVAQQILNHFERVHLGMTPENIFQGTVPSSDAVDKIATLAHLQNELENFCSHFLLTRVWSTILAQWTAFAFCFACITSSCPLTFSGRRSSFPKEVRLILQTSCLVTGIEKFRYDIKFEIYVDGIKRGESLKMNSFYGPLPIIQS